MRKSSKRRFRAFQAEGVVENVLFVDEVEFMIHFDLLRVVRGFVESFEDS